MKDKKATALEIKSTRLDVLVVELKNTNIEQINNALFKRFSKITDAASVPLLLDLSRFDVQIQSEIGKILPLFKHYGLNIIGIRHQDKAFETIATENKLAFNLTSTKNNQTNTTSEQTQESTKKITTETQTALPELEQGGLSLQTENISEQTNSTDKQADQEQEESETQKKEEMTPIAEPVHKPAMIVTRPVRTGQQIYAKDTDLILLNMVSAGAEVLADGNIHVYAPLRGKAMAGVKGNRQARIFTQCMQAELVSIAGKYRSIDQGLPQDIANKPVQIYIEQDKLMITALK